VDKYARQSQAEWAVQGRREGDPVPWLWLTHPSSGGFQPPLEEPGKGTLPREKVSRLSASLTSLGRRTEEFFSSFWRKWVRA
jgi:hypothetical protein